MGTSIGNDWFGEIIDSTDDDAANGRPISEEGVLADDRLFVDGVYTSVDANGDLRFRRFNWHFRPFSKSR